MVARGEGVHQTLIYHDLLAKTVATLDVFGCAGPAIVGVALVAYLTAENLVFRQQLLIIKRDEKLPKISDRD